MSEGLRIEVNVFEQRLSINDRVCAVDARAEIILPLNGCYSVPKLAQLKDKLNKVLRENLPGCLLREGGGPA